MTELPPKAYEIEIGGEMLKKFIDAEKVESIDASGNMNELVRRSDVSDMVISLQNVFSNSKDFDDGSDKQALIDQFVVLLLSHIEKKSAEGDATE